MVQVVAGSSPVAHPSRSPCWRGGFVLLGLEPRHLGGHQTGINADRCGRDNLVHMTQTYSPFLKVPEAAEALGVCERNIRNWIRDGQLPAIQPGGKGHRTGTWTTTTRTPCSAATWVLHTVVLIGRW